MKYCVASLFLLASSAAGASLRAALRAETQSNALHSQSVALDQQLQSVADKLEPGPTRDFLKTLRLCAPCKAYERIGEDHDGGYVTCMDGLDKGLVGAYSYGINGFDGWGMAMASRYHLPLNEYDCTNNKQPVVCQGCDVHFHGECILNNKGPQKANFKTLTQQLADSGNAKAKDSSLLLKIDVEAAEWKVFAEEPVENIKKFRQIVVEYHWLSEEHQHPLYLQAVKKIEQAGLVATHLHGNNYGGGLQYFGEYSIPNVLEVTYIQKPASGKCSNNIPYHLDMDQTNQQEAPEIGDAVLPTNL